MLDPLSLEGILQLASAAHARALRHIVAPVTGVPEIAAAGTLTLLAGAARVDLAAARLLLSAMGHTDPNQSKIIEVANLRNRKRQTSNLLG